MSYENFQKDYDKALANYVTVGCSRFEGGVSVAAEADTGSKYVVVVTKLDEETANYLGGGTKLVSVIYPWNKVYPLVSSADGLHDVYLAEKFVPHDRQRMLHGGDAGALFKTIRNAIRLLDGEVDSL